MKSIVLIVVILVSAFAGPVDLDLDNGEDIIEDTGEGVGEGIAEGTGEGIAEGTGEGIAEGTVEGGDEDNGTEKNVAEGVGGMVQIAQSRVVNGNSTTIEHFPWIVSMQYYGSHRCGGSIITTNRILTAAHCTINISPSLLSIRAGSTDSQTGGELVAVTEFTNHHSYNPTTLENDISVMVLASQLTTGSTVAVIALPMHGAAVPDGIFGMVAGWGALCENCQGTSTLQYVALPVLSNEDCSSMYGETLAPGMLCAGFAAGGRDACQGDSGGPLHDGNLLIGVVSWGDGCARPNSPGVFTRVAHYRNWINGQL